MDHFAKQKSESSMEEHATGNLCKEELVEEAMDMGYQLGSNGEEDTDSTDILHSPQHALHHSSSSNCCQGSVSWADQCWSKGEDQHMPECAEDTSHEATEESKREEQSTPLASLQDEHEPTVDSLKAGVTGCDLHLG